MSLRRIATAAAVVAAGFAASTTGAYALWSATATATLSVTMTSAPAAAPAAPTNPRCSFRTSTKSPTTVEIAWDGPNGVSFRVYRVGQATPMHTTNAKRTGQLGEGDFAAPVAPDRRYAVVVRSFDGVLESADSAQLTVDFAAAGCLP